MTEKKPELLLPLNNWKSIAPINKVLEYADAVYFGIQTLFSMRARADNFPLEEVPALVEMIHKMGKKCYLTTNILIYNTELLELYQAISFAKEAGVDAIICHDMATIMIAKQIEIPFHISTQANISNKVSAKFYESLGPTRLILARELNLIEIKEIIKEVGTGIECFVHGAMCTAVSGRCYLSAELMGHDPNFSANLGKCVQPCRRNYILTGEEGEKIEYEQQSGMFFNAKDLCMIAYIPELIRAGISSFKIEGRMRDPLYIGTTAQCYREAIDAYFDGTYTQEKVNDWVDRLSIVFNRGFHTGFYFEKPGPDDIERTIRGNVAKFHKKTVGTVKNYYKKAQAVEVDLVSGSLKVGQKLFFENRSDFYHHEPIQSLQLEEQNVDSTPEASKDKHILVGIKVKETIPMNARVFIYEKAKASKTK